MLYCRHCGVQVEPNHRVCPLCHELLENSPTVLPDPAQAFARAVEEVTTGSQQIVRKRGLIMVIYSVCLAIPGLVCLVVDQRYSGAGWSGYVLLSLGLSWAAVFIPLYFIGHSLATAMLIIVSVAAYLLGIDYLDGNLNWGLRLAMPILAWTALSIFGAWLSFQAWRKTLAFAFAGLLSAIALLCVGIDLSVDLFLKGTVYLGWSLVVVVAALPLVLIAVILGFAWKRSPRLRRFLHW